MSFLLASLRKDLSRWRGDKTSILFWIGIPLLIGGLITALVDQRGGAQPQGVLLIADLDQSLISNVLAGAYSQGQLGEMIVVEKVSLESGESRIKDGGASGLLIIPKGFGSAFLNEEAATLSLRTNPSQTILPGIITNVTEILLDGGFYAQKLFSEEIAIIRNAVDENGPDAALTAALTVAIQNKIQTAAPYLFDPAIDIVIEEPPADQPSIPMALLFLPGVILMALMFCANGLASDYWKERDQGTLRRLVFTPGQISSFVAGKALGAAIISAIIGGIALVVGFLYHDISWTKLPSSLVWVALSGVALFAWFGVLQMLANTRRAANLISSMLLFPLLMAGGSFFPFAALPDWIAAIGRSTPNGFVADRLTTEITAVSAWSIDPSSWLIIAAMAISGLALCTWRLKTGFARQ